MSGLARWSSAVGPREVNAAIVSSARSTVPMWLEAPTVSTQGAFPGDVMPPYCVWLSGLRPLFPAAATTVIPARTARSAASVSGSVVYDSYTPVATERLITRIFSASRLRHRVVERRDDIADVPAAGLVEHLQHDEMRARCDAGSCAVRVDAIAADDAGHVRPVAVVVMRCRDAVDEVDELNDALPHSSVGEVVVPGRDSRIDHGDADPCPIETQILPDRNGTDRRAGSFHRPDDIAIQRHALDERARREHPKHRIRYDRDVARTGRQFAAGDCHRHRE